MAASSRRAQRLVLRRVWPAFCIPQRLTIIGLLAANYRGGETTPFFMDENNCGSIRTLSNIPRARTACATRMGCAVGAISPHSGRLQAMFRRMGEYASVPDNRPFTQHVQKHIGAESTG